MKWPDLKLNPINLWNVPKMTPTKKCVLDKIEEEIFRYFIRYKGNFPRILYIGDAEYGELMNLLDSNNKIDLQIIKVKKETYLKVG